MSKRKTIKDYLKDIIPEDKIDSINRSFEIVGDIAICEIDDEFFKYEKEIADAIMKINKSIKVVLKKSGIHHGEFRTQDLVYIGGEDRKETLYQENGIKMIINPETVYFSARLSTERAELFENLEKDKKILIMFSGAGPYTFVALKKQPNLKKIVSIEINPEGHKYALKSLELNKSILKKCDDFKLKIEQLKQIGKYVNEKEILKEIIDEKVQFINGDVREVVENELKGETFDEIYMPLPKDAEEFLDSAFIVSKTGTVIHMYNFCGEEEFPNKTENIVKDIAKKYGVKIEIIETRKVGQYSPRKYRVCCDFKII